MTADNKLQEAKDMKCVLKQQIWVQNCARIFRLLTKAGFQETGQEEENKEETQDAD